MGSLKFRRHCCKTCDAPVIHSFMSCTLVFSHIWSLAMCNCFFFFLDKGKIILLCVILINFQATNSSSKMNFPSKPFCGCIYSNSSLLMWECNLTMYLNNQLCSYIDIKIRKHPQDYLENFDLHCGNTLLIVTQVSRLINHTYPARLINPYNKSRGKYCRI